MVLWFIFGLMTLAAVLPVVWRLARSSDPVPGGSEIAVYRDQLAELDRDFAVGLIGKAEAEAARVEISRRLLAAADAAGAVPSPATATWHQRAVFLAALVLLPAGSMSLYLWLGSPHLAAEPSSARQRNAGAGRGPSIDDLVAKVERHLQSDPKDGHGWEALAPVYMQLGRYTDSVNAWRNTLQLLGENAERQANLGEALFAESNGLVTDEAKQALTRAVTLDKSVVSARYYLGMAAEQDGRAEEAARIWRDLIAGAPAGAHWLDNVRAALARVEGNPAAEASAPSSAPDTTSAAKPPPDQQAAMIRGMVDGLAARLKQDGSDLDGWVKLVRSYRVLGEQDQAQAAVRDARRAFANDSAKREQLELALKDLEGGAVSTRGGSDQPTQSKAAQPPHDGDAIPAMVARLAERLRHSPSDAEGWIMLTRSYITLGEQGKAATAIKEARAALAKDPAKLQLFNETLQLDRNRQ